MTLPASGAVLPKAESESARPEAAILALIEQGKRREALVAMMTTYGDSVFEHCARIVNDRTLAADVHQQVFLAAFRDLDTFQQRSTLRTWLFHIATHRALDAIRHRRRRQDREEDDAQVDGLPAQHPGPAEHIDSVLVRGALDDCLARLADKVRASVLLRFRSEMSYDEMALVLDEKAGTLQARVARALPALRACLEAKGVAP